VVERGVRRAIAIWRSWWFTPAPLTELGLARIVLAAIVLYLDGGLLNGQQRFAGIAMAPPIAWQPIVWIDWLGFTQPSAAQVRLLHHATQILLLGVALGLFTRVALAGAFVLQLVLEALLNCFGKVTHSTIPLLYAMLFFALSPCDRAFAFDVLRWRRWPRAGQDVLRREERDNLSPYARWPFELLFIELALFYFHAGYSKLSTGGLGWADGYTLQYHLVHRQQPLGLWLAPHLWLCRLLSILVLAFELGFPVAILARRLRAPFLIGGVVFHLANQLLLTIMFWPVLAVYALFVPWLGIAARLRRMVGKTVPPTPSRPP
jgi:hypothetical protein